MKCEYWIGILWIVAYIITVTCSTLMPEVLIILALILWFVYYMLKHISIISMWIKGWLNGKGMFTIMILVIVIFFALWYNGLICKYSGIFTPLFSLLAVIVAYRTLCSQREQNAIQNFENHLFEVVIVEFVLIIMAMFQMPNLQFLSHYFPLQFLSINLLH